MLKAFGNSQKYSVNFKEDLEKAITLLENLVDVLYCQIPR